MIKAIIYILVLIFLSLESSAQEKSDSVLKEFPEVTVESEKPSEHSHSAFLAGRILNKKELEIRNPWQANEALTMSSGIYIRNYGGLGGLKTISLRGGDAGQTSIMLDGVRMNSNGSGMLDLSILPSSFFNSVEIIRGGSSSSSAGGMDGIVNFLTMRPDRKFNLKAQLSMASFNERRIAISEGFPVNKMYFSLDGEYLYSKGDYPFETNQFGESIKAKRMNGDFENINFSASMRYKESKFHSFSRLLWRASRRGSPGAVLQGHIESKDARLNEQDIMLYSKNDLIIDSLSLISINGYCKFGTLAYSDSSFFTMGFAEGKFNSKDAGISARYLFNSALYSNELELSYFFSDLKGSMINSENGDYVNRHNLSANAKSEIKMELLKVYNISTFFSSRLDYFSDAGTAFSPLMGISFAKKEVPLKLKIAFSYNFRPPSFNEKFYFNYGNKDLKSEKQYSSSITLESMPLKNLNLMISAFNNLTFDKIIYIQTSPMAGITQNFGKVKSKGFEFELKYSIFNNFIEFGYNYTYQLVNDALDSSMTFGKIIPYTPRELISGQVLFNYQGFILGANIEFISHRFALGDNSFESLLPYYFVINSFVSYNLKIRRLDLTARFDALNLNDEKYAVIKNYPMPGRMFRATLLINI